MLERADAQDPVAAAGARVELGAREPHPRDDRVRVREEEPPLRRQRRVARSTVAVDQPAADDRLERGDLLADGRLDVPEAGGRSPERSFLGHGLERDEMTKLGCEPAVGNAVSRARHAQLAIDTRSPVFRRLTMSVRLRSDS